MEQEMLEQEMLEQEILKQDVTYQTTMLWRTEDFVIILSRSHDFVQINLLSPAKILLFYQEIETLSTCTNIYFILNNIYFIYDIYLFYL